MRTRNHIYINGFALSLVLKQKLGQLDEDRLRHIRSYLSLRSNRFRAKCLLRELNPPRMPVNEAEGLRIHRLRILFTTSGQHSVTIKILRMRVFYSVSCFITFHCWQLQGYYDTYIMKCIEKCEKKPLLIGM